jgi:hypothetical protein
MKPLHIALLAIGATLAGDLAFQMTQLAPLSQPTAPVAAATAESTPAPAVSSVAPTPPAVHEKTKPSPMPDVLAPPAIYEDHVSAAPALRKDAPAAVRTPMAAASTKPVQWTAVPYQPPPKDLIAQAPVSPLPAEPAPKPEPRKVTLNTGTVVVIRLSEPLSADRATDGDLFHAILAEPVVADGLVIAERGARVTGRIVEAHKPGRFGAKSLLELELSNLATSDGQDIPVSTDPWTEQSDQLVNVPSSLVIRFHLAGRVTITERQL